MPSPNLRYDKKNILKNLSEGNPSIGEPFYIVGEISETGDKGKDASQGYEHIVQNNVRGAWRVEHLDDRIYVVSSYACRISDS